MNKKPVSFSDSKIKRFEKIVKQQTEEKKQELKRALDNKIDEIFEKKFKSFLKDVKILKDLDNLKKADEEYDVFIQQLEAKKEKLLNTKEKCASIVVSILERQAKINDWNEAFSYGNDYDYYLRKLQSICRDELMKQLRKTTNEGNELEAIDNKVNNLLLTLSYPNLVADEVDLNKALENGGSMLAIALNPSTLKKLEQAGVE